MMIQLVFYLLSSILIRKQYLNGIIIFCSVWIISGNPSSFLAMANIMQYLMLFIFIYLKSYPTLLLDFLTTNGIFGFDFIASLLGI